MSKDRQLTGTLVSKTSRYHHVAIDSTGRIVPCTIASRLRKRFIYSTADPSSMPRRVQAVKAPRSVDPVAIGDRVNFSDNGDGTGFILGVQNRRNKLSRRASGNKPNKHIEQVIVANIDYLIAVFSLAQPRPKWNLIDRYLASAEAEAIPAAVCMTKADLRDTAEIESELEPYRKIGYPVLITSALTVRGLDELRNLVQNRTSVLTGPSGVGKTTLLNLLQPGLGQRVGEISRKTGKGKHTTRNLTMFSLDFGGFVVDTPGMREFGLWHQSSEEMQYLFPEMRPYIGTCRFGLGCRHRHEPDCAIKQAVDSREIHPRRYANYLKLAGL